MEKNIQINLFIKQLNQSNALAHTPMYLAHSADYNFKILDTAYSETGKMYAALKTAINTNRCSDPYCFEENERLNFLLNVGLDYLTLSRESGTLSGGEAQRIRLASQIGSGLTGVLYVLDEPSIGLHQKDNVKLINALKRLRDLGNTVIVVEHDTETMENADHIIDLGPEAGSKGGEVIAQGTIKEITANKESITGKY